MFRAFVEEMKAPYREESLEKMKTKLVHSIVEHVWNNGGRFIEKDSITENFKLLEKPETRRRTCLALQRDPSEQPSFY